MTPEQQANFTGWARGISHYHLRHTNDVVTRFVIKTIDHEPPEPEHTIHIYVTSTPEARKAFAEVGERFGMKPIPEDYL
jgi:hypothetical protein